MDSTGAKPPVPPCTSYVLGAADPPRRLGRWALHGGLLVTTFITLSITGGCFWEAERTQLALQDLPPGVLALTWASFVAGLEYASWVVAILGAHEMGHYLTCRHYRIPATLPFFLPGPPFFIGTFGAVIRIRGVIPHRRALFDIAAAGPLAGFVVLVPALVIGLRRAQEVVPQDEGAALGLPLAVVILRSVIRPDLEHFVVNAPFGAAWVGLLVTSLNLFPVGQLDGGHAAYAISRRLHRLLAFTTLAAVAALIVQQAWTAAEIPAYVVWLALLLWMRDRHPRIGDEFDALGRTRQLIAVLLLLMLVVSFIPVPLRLF